MDSKKQNIWKKTAKSFHREKEILMMAKQLLHVGLGILCQTRLFVLNECYNYSLATANECDFCTHLWQMIECILVNLSWPSDAIWRHRTWSTLVQIMAYRLTVLNHYLKRNNVDQSSVRSCGVRLKVILCDILNISIPYMGLKIINLTLQLHLTGATKLSNSSKNRDFEII